MSCIRVLHAWSLFKKNFLNFHNCKHFKAFLAILDGRIIFQLKNIQNKIRMVEGKNFLKRHCFLYEYMYFRKNLNFLGIDFSKITSFEIGRICRVSYSICRISTICFWRHISFFSFYFWVTAILYVVLRLVFCLYISIGKFSFSISKKFNFGIPTLI